MNFEMYYEKEFIKLYSDEIGVEQIIEQKYKKHAIKYNYDLNITIFKKILKKHDVKIKPKTFDCIKKEFFNIAKLDSNTPFYKELDLESIYIIAWSKEGNKINKCYNDVLKYNMILQTFLKRISNFFFFWCIVLVWFQV